MRCVPCSCLVKKKIENEMKNILHFNIPYFIKIKKYIASQCLLLKKMKSLSCLIIFLNHSTINNLLCDFLFLC